MTRNKINLALIVSMIVFLISACSNDANKETKAVQEKPKTVPVKVVQVQEKLLSVPLNSVGKVFSQKESTLSFKTAGIIDKIFVNNGQRVKKNDLLAKLDLSEISSSVKKARVAYDKARRDLDRAENLYKDNVVTLETLENAQTAYDVASSDLTIAQFNLEYSVIKAPSDGLILQKVGEEGELTNAGAPIFEFAGTNQSWVIKSGLVDKEVVKVAIGDSADITFDAYPNEIFVGLVTKISNAPDPGNGTYEVEVALSSFPNTLKKGFIAKLALIPSEKLNYKIIPIESLAEADNDDGVIYMVENDRPKKVNVKIETIMEDKVLVFGKLDANDLVISEGIDNVHENSIIEIL